MHKILIFFLTILITSCKSSDSETTITNIEAPQEDRIESPLNKFPVEPNLITFLDQLEEFDDTFQAVTYSSDYTNTQFALKFSLRQFASINQITFSGGNTKRDDSINNDINISYTVYEVSGDGLFKTLTIVNNGIAEADFSKTLTTAGTYNILLDTPIELNSGQYALVLQSHQTSDIKISIGFRTNQAGYRYYSHDSNYDEWRESGIGKLLIRISGTCIDPCS